MGHEQVKCASKKEQQRDNIGTGLARDCGARAVGPEVFAEQPPVGARPVRLAGDGVDLVTGGDRVTVNVEPPLLPRHDRRLRRDGAVRGEAVGSLCVAYWEGVPRQRDGVGDVDARDVVAGPRLRNQS